MNKDILVDLMADEITSIFLDNESAEEQQRLLRSYLMSAAHSIMTNAHAVAASVDANQASIILEQVASLQTNMEFRRQDIEKLCSEIGAIKAGDVPLDAQSWRLWNDWRRAISTAVETLSGRIARLENRSQTYGTEKQP